MITISLAEPIAMIDEFLKKLGTQSLVDGDLARDQLLELRSSLTAMSTAENNNLISVSSDGPWDEV